jgi:hypothetical protein
VLPRPYDLFVPTSRTQHAGGIVDTPHVYHGFALSHEVAEALCIQGVVYPGSVKIR